MKQRLNALKRRHLDLEEQLARELRRPKPDELAIKRIKLLKLHIKDEMTFLQARGRQVNLHEMAS